MDRRSIFDAILIFDKQNYIYILKNNNIIINIYIVESTLYDNWIRLWPRIVCGLSVSSLNNFNELLVIIIGTTHTTQQKRITE